MVVQCRPCMFHPSNTAIFGLPKNDQWNSTARAVALWTLDDASGFL